MSKIKDIPMIKVNMSKAACCRCGKSVDWTDVNIIHLSVAETYPLCDECKQAVRDFINNKEN